MWGLIVLVAVSSGLPAVGAESPGSSTARIRAASSLDLSAHRGSVVVVHFWATWCGPCLAEMPSLISFYHDTYPALRQRGHGLVVILVSRDVRREDLRHFLADRDGPFPVVFDPYGRLADRLGMPAVPGTVMLGPEGEVVQRHLGTADWQGSRWLQGLRRLLQGDG